VKAGLIVDISSTRIVEGGIMKEPSINPTKSYPRKIGKI
jgi:hypothetical protein